MGNPEFMAEKAKVKVMFRKGKMRDLVMLAVESGVRFRRTPMGVIFYGQNGYSFTVHCTESDHRAVLNAESRFRKIGIELKGRK